MLVRHASARLGCRLCRRGVAIPWFLICAPVLALLAIWAVYSADLHHRKVELEIGAEAAALAAARDLVDDVLLTELPARQEFVEKRARHEARAVANDNFLHRHRSS